MRASVSIRQYGRYTVVGAVVGFITIGLREIAGWLLPADNPQFYLFSVVLAYAFGIVLNYLLQRALTFRYASPDGRQLTFFVIVALIGAIATALLALVFRYGLPLDLWWGRWSPALAFAAAALASSLLTYWLNAQFVFQGRNTS
jgi:putative flippase GtrA